MIACEECSRQPASGLFAGYGQKRNKQRGRVVAIMFLCGGCGFNISGKRRFMVLEDEGGRERILRPLKFPGGVKLIVSGVNR